MARRIDWAKHNSMWEKSGKTIKDYCREAGISASSFMNYRYTRPRDDGAKKKDEAGFSALSLTPGIRVIACESGEFSIHGVSENQLPALLRAAHVVSE